MIRIVSLLGLVLLLAACAARPPAAPATLTDSRYQQRLAGFAQPPDWVINARLAVNDGKDGGSGKLRWQHSSRSDRMHFHGALGRGAWRMEASEQGAELHRADGSTAQAASLDQLVEMELGKALPVGELSWWVMGLAAPGPVQGLELDAEGRPLRLRQSGWDIEFQHYRESHGHQLPVRLRAEHQNWVVKLAVRNWQFTHPADSK